MATIPEDVTDLILEGGEQLAQQTSTLVATQVTELVPDESEAIIIRRVTITAAENSGSSAFIWHDRDGTTADLTTLVYDQFIVGLVGADSSTDILQTDILISTPFESLMIAATPTEVLFTFYGSRLQT